MSGYQDIMRNTWVGIATKIGGGLIAAGVESTTGVIFNAAHPSWHSAFTIESVRLQLGIGGGIGVAVVIVLDCQSVFWLNGIDVDDWGVNISLGPKWSSLVTGLAHMGFFKSIGEVKKVLESTKTIDKWKAAAAVGRLTPEHMEAIKGGVNYFWNSYDMAKRNGKPSIFALDVPGQGIGAEISVCPIIKGKFSILPNA